MPVLYYGRKSLGCLAPKDHLEIRSIFIINSTPWFATTCFFNVKVFTNVYNFARNFEIYIAPSMSKCAAHQNAMYVNVPFFSTMTPSLTPLRSLKRFKNIIVF